MNEQGVLPQCPALSELRLANRLEQAGVLPQCPHLSVLDFVVNHIGANGTGRFAGVLQQCPALSELRLGGNQSCALEETRLELREETRLELREQDCRSAAAVSLFKSDRR
jgi:hypothetical protein